MKCAIALAAFGLGLLGFANDADAYTFSPSNTNFTFTGYAIIAERGLKLSCQATAVAQTDATGQLKINYLSLSAGQGCSLVKAGGLPWTVTATSAYMVTISELYLILSNGNCGPGPVPGILGGGKFDINAVNNLAYCSIVSGLASTPAIKIIP